MNGAHSLIVYVCDQSYCIICTNEHFSAERYFFNNQVCSKQASQQGIKAAEDEIKITTKENDTSTIQLRSVTLND